MRNPPHLRDWAERARGRIGRWRGWLAGEEIPVVLDPPSGLLWTLERATPRDLLDLQLDDRALFLQRWRGLLLRPGSEETSDVRSASRRPSSREKRCTP